MIGQKGMMSPNGGGIERHVTEISTRLAELGHTVTVYRRSWYPKDAISISLPSIPTKHLDTITHTFLATIHTLWRIRPEIIHYHGVGPALISWLPRLFSPRTKIITTFHCIDRAHEKWGVLARAFLMLGEWMAVIFAHETIVVSKTLETYVHTRYRQTPTYIPNGATLLTHTSTNALHHIGLESQSYILSVTRLIPHKGTLELISAWLALSTEARREKKLVIAGNGYHTDAYVHTLKKLAENDPDILFTGAQSGDTLRALYTHAYAFVHPSRSEGMPIAVLEAMGAGLPVLISDIPEHRELGSDPTHLVPLYHSNALLLALSRLIQENPARLKESGENNRLRAAAAYNWEHIVRDIALLYTKQVHSVNTRMSSFPSKSTS